MTPSPSSILAAPKTSSRPAWGQVVIALGFLMTLGVSVAIAQNSGNGQYQVWRGKEALPDLQILTAQGRQFVKAVSVRPADEAAWKALEKSVNISRTRLGNALDLNRPIVGATSAATPKQMAAPTGPRYIQPVTGMFVEGPGRELTMGAFRPANIVSEVANHPLAATEWVRSFTSNVTGYQGRETVFREPNINVASVMSGKAIYNMAARRFSPGELTYEAGNNLDQVGGTFFVGAQLALTGYVLEALEPRQPATTAQGFTLFDLAATADAIEAKGNSAAFSGGIGVSASRLLGIGGGWAMPWASLSQVDARNEYGPTAPITGVVRSLMANSGPAAIRHLIESDWPKKGGAGGSSDYKAWLNWADERIRSAPYGDKWQSATPTVHDLGFAASYTAALADMIALPDRIADAGGNRPIPRSFADGLHLKHAFEIAPCQKLDINMSSAVQEIEVELPEIAARCVQLVWTGPTYGPDQTVPTLFVSAKTDSGDIADLKLASSMNSHTGLVVESLQTNESVKTWSLPFKPDLVADGQRGIMTKTMTLGLVVIAPNAVDTKPMNVKLTLGMGVVETTGAISANVDVARPEQECNMQPIASPNFIGPVPAMVALGGGGEEGDDTSFKMGGLEGLFGLSLATNRSDLDKVVPAIGCIGSPQGGGGAGLVASRAFQRLTPQSSRDPEGGFCTQEGIGYNEYLSQQTRNPPRSIREISMTRKDGASLSGSSIAVEATAKLLDPAKPETARTVDVDMEGTVTFSIRTATRLKGTISLRTKQTDETSCPTNARGSLQTSFDIVAALPLMSNVSLRETNWMEMMDPLMWSIMTPSQREAAKTSARQSAEEARRARGNNGATGVLASPAGGQCTCECDEFNNPERREACGSQCLYYGPISGRCVQDRERARGVPDDTIIQALNQCPTTCAQFATRGNQLCDDAFWFISRTCRATTNQSGFVTPEQEKCWIDLSTDSMTGAQGAEYRSMLARQLADMDQQGKVLLIIPSLEALAREGKRCP